MRLNIKSTLLNIFIAAGVVFGSAGLGLQSAIAACAPITSTMGTVTNNVNVTTPGSYTVWSRIMPDSANTQNNSYTLEMVQGSTNVLCGQVVGDTTTMTANTWTWVKTSAVTLASGALTMTMIGREDGVKLDRVLLLADANCNPTGTGDDCASAQDSTAPVATITAPANNASVTTTTNITVTATDAKGVTVVNLALDGVTVKTNTTAPLTSTSLTYSFDPTGKAGSHTLVAYARDSAGNQSVNSTVTFTVPAVTPVDTTPPVVTFTAPAAGSSITGTTNITANATDLVGVTSFDLFLDGTKVKTVTNGTMSYAYTPTAANNGSRTFTAEAYDAASNKSITATRTFTVTISAPADTTAPNLTITSPITNAVMSGATYPLTATATDNTGGSGMSKVEFYIDGATAPINTDTTSPYSYSLNTTSLSNTAHTVKMIAYDVAGNKTTASVNATSSNVVTPPPKTGDFNGDTVVNFKDLLSMLSKYGAAPSAAPGYDLNNDGAINFKDLLSLLSKYGS